MVHVKVPASSANMGAGFDCLGAALSLYSFVEMEETESGLHIQNIDMGSFIPENENNLVYRAAMRVFDETAFYLRGLIIRQKSDIPPTRGLGSSSACIIGGMLAANVISGRKLTYRDILDLACEMEGHPDNVTPALYGGICICARDGGHVSFDSAKPDGNIRFAIHVPDYFMTTKKSRTMLPDGYKKEDVVYNISHAALTYAAFASGRTELLRTSVADRLHQDYRKEYITGYDDICSEAYRHGALCTYLSGSGPSLVSVIDSGNTVFAEKMNAFYKEKRLGVKCSVLGIDNVGAVVCETQMSKLRI